MHFQDCHRARRIAGNGGTERAGNGGDRGEHVGTIAAQPLDATLLILLAQASARPTALAARLDISKQALNFVLARLQRDGLVIREDDPDDRRAKQIRLTTAGRQAADLTRAALTRLERRWRSIVGEDWPQLRASLAAIAFHSLPPAD